MKVVAVSQRVDILKGRDETRDALDQRLVMFIAASGNLVVPIPNTLQETNNVRAWFTAIKPSAIVLSGGNSIGEVTTRDQTESRLLDYAHDNELPVLGICRGMQMMAHWAGTSLHSVEGHVQTRHQLTGQIITDVNSFHDFSLANCPYGFEVLANSEDGEIEAIRHLSLPWEGWMWHPEREENFSDQDLERFKGLMSE